MLFADDSTLSTSFAEENALEFTLTLSHELNNVECEVLIKNYSQEFTIISFLYSSADPILILVKCNSFLNEKIIYFVFSALIQIRFDVSQLFKNHVDLKDRKISKFVGIFFELSKYLSQEIIKTFYYSLINPFLLYGIEVWHGTYANITNKIFILQEKGLAEHSIFCLSILTQLNTLKM